MSVFFRMLQTRPGEQVPAAERIRSDEGDRIYNNVMLDERATQPVQEAARATGLSSRMVVVLAHLDPRAFGIAVGLVCGFWFWLATFVLLLRGGSQVGQNLILLSQYFIGFRVTPGGALVAFGYGALMGFLAGYLFARWRNFMMRAYLLFLRRRAERVAMADLLDRLM